LLSPDFESLDFESLDFESPDFESAPFGSAGLDALALLSSGLEAAGAVEVGALAVPVEDAGEAVDVGVEGVGVEDGVVGDGVPAGAGEESGAAVGALPLFFSRGGPSVGSKPTGTDSAFIAVFGFSVPAGSHSPVPIHGFTTLGELLCSALLTVKSPCELPAFSTSYTVPVSSDIGTGAALYSDASQNLPSTKIAIGTSAALPLASSCITASARGPTSLLLIFRSPGVICGRDSCATALPARSKNPAATMTNDRRYKILSCESRIEAGQTDAACATLVTPALNFPEETSMNINDKAPDFTLQDENGKEIASKDLRGKTIVLYFYPRADTPGCTIEACEFRDTYKQIQKTGAVLLGISPDTPKAQKKFADKFTLPFTLLADADKTVANAFGVMKEKNMYGKKVMGVARTTFVVGPDGKIVHIFEKVKPEGHAEEVLAYLKKSAKGAA
jgi:peroxiredoxin Q/BCP